MKKILLTLSAVFLGLIALPEKAEARSHHHSSYKRQTYFSGYTSCGCPLYKKRIVVSYNRRNQPIYKYYNVPITHRCDKRYSRHHRYKHSGYRKSRFRSNRYYKNRRNHISFSIRGAGGSFLYFR